MDWITATLRLFLFGMGISGLITLEGGLLLAVLVQTSDDAWGGLFLT